jgi:O-acetyl-ADP-ribose deacetylase (regulator of RNase III)
MTIIKLTIIDCDLEKIAAIKSCFDGEPHVSWMVCDIKSVPRYDCLITPGNSFGIMDGGFDEAVKDLFGEDIERRVQYVIQSDAFGELNVGDATLVVPARPGSPLLCYAPTMRVPMQITRTDNVYCAMRAALASIYQHNMLAAIRDVSMDLIRTVVCPVLGSGAGKMPPKQAAMQMKLAWDGMKEGRQPITSWDQADALQKRIGLGFGGDPDNY